MLARVRRPGRHLNDGQLGLNGILMTVVMGSSMTVNTLTLHLNKIGIEQKNPGHSFFDENRLSDRN